MKIYKKQNVYDATQERLKYIFDSYQNVLVSFSGGKDSGVLLNLCYDYARSTNQLDKLAFYHLDYEAQYKYTTDYVTRTFERFNDVRNFWLCLPVGANCGCSMETDRWIPWNPSEKQLWCRNYPDIENLIYILNCPFDYDIGEQDYSVQEKFCEWFEKEYGSTAILIGIRCDESLDRYNAISNNGWITKTNKCFPIYDWKTEDIWTANAKFNYDYNNLYDLYYKAGLSLRDMRVANPFHTCGLDNLKLYSVIDPENWSKMITRINGVNFGKQYGGTSAINLKNKPSHFTWKEYEEFLYSTLINNKQKLKINEYINKWKTMGYDEDIPDEVNYFVDLKRNVPSYKKICKSILSNDISCKQLGYNVDYKSSWDIVNNLKV